jgi:hypothetical protein
MFFMYTCVFSVVFLLTGYLFLIVFNWQNPKIKKEYKPQKW